MTTLIENAPIYPLLLQHELACPGQRADAYQGLTVRQAYDQCADGFELLWVAAALVERGALDRRLLVRAACAAARCALPYVPDSEHRPLAAIETAERWTRGDATIEEVYTASANAGAYANIYADYAIDAAVSAANTVVNTYAATNAAHYAAVAAATHAAAHATRAADVYVAARSKMRQQTADAVRDVLTFDVMQDALAMLPIAS